MKSCWRCSGSGGPPSVAIPPGDKVSGSAGWPCAAAAPSDSASAIAIASPADVGLGLNSAHLASPDSEKAIVSGRFHVRLWLAALWPYDVHARHATGGRGHGRSSGGGDDPGARPPHRRSPPPPVGPPHTAGHGPGAARVRERHASRPPLPARRAAGGPDPRP